MQLEARECKLAQIILPMDMDLFHTANIEIEQDSSKV
jgi:hypothetical protein